VGCNFQCPFCQRYTTQTMPQIKQTYVDTGKVRYVLKNFPLTQIHPQALAAAEAAECAGEQGKFWDMHDKLFAEQKQWADNSDAVSVFKGFAKDLGLDEKAFEECVTSARYQDKIMADQKEDIAAGVQGTPAFFINGIVNVPVVRTLATELPLTVPIRPLETTAAFAGPP